MRIELINKTPHFLKTIWSAGRTCHSADSPAELFCSEQTESSMLKLVDFLVRQRHLSTLEHCSVTFSVADVSRTLLAQYSRHRIGVSLSVQSQRYVSERSGGEGLFDFVVPPTVKKDEQKATYRAAMEAAQQFYDKLLSQGVPMEDARFVLPGGICTQFVTTLNLRSFLDIYEKRVLVKGAQWEIREMVCVMARLLVEAEPWLERYLPQAASE